MEKIIKFGSKAGKALGKITKGLIVGSVDAGPALVSAGAFANSAVEVTGITDPFEASKVAFKMVFKRCVPPQYYVLGECTSLTFHLYAWLTTGGSWNYTAVFLWLSRFVFEKEAP